MLDLADNAPPSNNDGTAVQSPAFLQRDSADNGGERSASRNALAVLTCAAPSSLERCPPALVAALADLAASDLTESSVSVIAKFPVTLARLK